MDDYEKTSLSIIKRAVLRRRQQEAIWKATDREDARWPNRLRRAVYSGLLYTGGMSLLLLSQAYPWMYPRDLEGLGILFGVSVLLAAYLFVSGYVQDWVDAREKRYWFWRAVSVLGSLAIGGGMIYGIIVSADYWLPHFQ
jgi:hypothetical protein